MIKKHDKLLWKIVCVGFMLVGSQSIFADKIPVEKLDDLPRYTYKIDIRATDLYTNEKVLAELTKQVKKDLLSDLEKYDIKDVNTLQNYYANLGSIAIIESNWDEYLNYVKLRQELESKESNRLTASMLGRAVAQAKLKGGDDFNTEFRDAFVKLVNGLPYEVVQDALKSTKGSSEIISMNLIMGVIAESVQPQLDKTDGEMSAATARGLLGRYFTVKYFIPLKDIVQEELAKVIAANTVVKEDIWADRNVTLTKDDAKHEVVLAVWDSGVDTEIFKNKNQIWTNKDEIPGNGIDDDKNGYIDDVHGIAYTLENDKTIPQLYPIGDISDNEAELRSQNKGLIDIQASVESEEATALKKKLSSMEQTEVKPFIEQLNLYGGYSHGTHVAGIAAEGNPYARIMGARITFGHTMIPEVPTIEMAKKYAISAVETIEYFKANGVRAVNMSWGGSLAGIEQALEINNAGGTAEERKKLAREIYNIGIDAFRDAVQNAPDILFVAAAGNSDNNVTFEEFYPSSFDYPNIISVGAVDQAGDETSFTSFGKVEVYANGFQVESYVPGGVRIKYSGTSMASPQVLNLVGKMLAINPDLTTAQLRQLVIDGADAKDTGTQTIALINPKKTLELVRKL